ncbi:hypothetical protein [Prosthecobacter vanneervenii]|uniref:Uncharacterized protein n=1 Tax=Prosthecobacter vanneervenii TaxID=48466 RepID=A0A7W7YG40_9BACT|nr:hypothetical protein [Prosthecobacter vanneervenii]MBB5035527.1 hypothetical protein [Prosthecobacter vanneervenii]
MKSLLPHHRQPAGFAPQGCFELLFLVQIVGGIVSLAFGNWISAGLLLGPICVLFFVFKYLERRDRCRVGDNVRVTLGAQLYRSKEGMIIEEHMHAGGRRFMVKLSCAEHPDPVDLPAYHLIKVKRSASIPTTDETAS